MRSPLICIDPGHGGSDPGACAEADQEKYLVLDIAFALRTALLEQGFAVCMTRETDIYDTPGKKAQKANNSSAAAFISIHCNAAENQAARGTETLSYGLVGKSFQLAQAVQREVIAACKTVDRGVKNRKDLTVLNQTLMPAILLETAFISNAEDRRLLRDFGFQKKMADAVAKGVCSFFGREYRGTAKEEREMEKRYQTLSELPKWARPAIEKLVADGKIAEKDHLDLSLDMLRTIVILQR